MSTLTTLSLKSFSKRTVPLLFFLFILCFSKIYGQTHSFSGTIGKYPIYLQMVVDGGRVSGYYFYKNKLIDISLEGTSKSGQVTLKSSDEYGQDISDPETFKFKWPNKTIQGTWSQKGKSLPLKLAALTSKETGSPKCSNPYFKKEVYATSDLTKVKVGLFKLKEVNTVQTINHVKIRHFEETNTKITLFRIDSGLVADRQKDANLYLEFLQISECLSSLGCASYSTYGSDYSYSVSDINISNDLISFSVFAAYYCGGAHPEESNYGISYDLTKHQPIKSSDFLIPGKESIYEERVYAYLAKNNPKYFSENNESEEYDANMDCQYFQRELWTADCDFVLTSDGIKLLPSFAHYAAPCLEPEWAVIPYSELKDLIKPEYYGKLNQLKP
ncbi:hypothetical protein [Fluviicola taffensis]|uniref:hypothetical protein n=1 Tax=Fluviicola taffensis TaxID=191579 RepID=UPI003137D0F8